MHLPDSYFLVRTERYVDETISIEVVVLGEDAATHLIVPGLRVPAVRLPCLGYRFSHVIIFESAIELLIEKMIGSCGETSGVLSSASCMYWQFNNSLPGRTFVISAWEKYGRLVIGRWISVCQCSAFGFTSTGKQI